MQHYDIVILGAGAAGCFAAIRCKELSPQARVLILEKSARTLDKVRISGGGRCNVTHHQFDARALSQNYPRGEKELLGPLKKWGPADMVDWLTGHGVTLKTETDGRMFPTTDSSATIVDLFLGLIRQSDIHLITQSPAPTFNASAEGFIVSSGEKTFGCKKLLIATGSSLSVWDQLADLGHAIIPPVPSLFSFNSRDALITGLPGISLTDVALRIPQMRAHQRGPMLITHAGLSGPAVLRISAWHARQLAEVAYRFPLVIDYLPNHTHAEIADSWEQLKAAQPKTKIANLRIFPLPARLWERICQLAGVADLALADLGKKGKIRLSELLKNATIAIDGKSTNKEEFVTAGGVDLREVDFRTMESKIIPNLHLAGEVLDIDAITGGFNFQAAWTTAELAAQAIVRKD